MFKLYCTFKYFCKNKQNIKKTNTIQFLTVTKHTQKHKQRFLNNTAFND